MRTSTVSVLGLGLALIASVPACIERTAGDPADLRAFLAEPRRFALDPDQTEIELGVERQRDSGQIDRASLELPTLDGALVVVADGETLVLEDLSLALAPVTLPTDIHPGDTRLVEVRIGLPAVARCERTVWSDDGTSASCQVSIDLTVDWSLEIDGTPYPLGAITLPDLAIDLRVVSEPDALRVDLQAKAAGEVWSWLGVIAFADLTLDLRGYLD